MATQSQFAAKVAKDFERELLDALPELAAAVDAGEGEASFTCTLQIRRTKATKSKVSRLVAALKPRVRAPKPVTEYDVMLDQGELALDFGDNGKGAESPSGQPSTSAH